MVEIKTMTPQTRRSEVCSPASTSRMEFVIRGWSVPTVLPHTESVESEDVYKLKFKLKKEVSYCLPFGSVIGVHQSIKSV